MDLELVAYYIGGQQTKSHTFRVQAGDVVIAMGSCNQNEIMHTLSGVQAELLARVGANINQTAVWLVKASGYATYTQSGKGNNWDHIVGLLRPTRVATWEPRIWYTDYPPNAPRVEAYVPKDTYVFIHRYAGTGNNVNQPPTITGVPYETVVDVLPEGSANPGNARETVIRTKDAGRITIVGPKTTWMQVAFVLAKAVLIMGDVTWI